MNIAMADESKVYKIKIKLDKLNMPDKINFHKQANDIIYVDLWESTLGISKLNKKLSKLEGKLKQEKATNKALKVHIKKLESDLLVVGEDTKDIQTVKNLLDERDNTIQVLKKKLKIPDIEHI